MYKTALYCFSFVLILRIGEPRSEVSNKSTGKKALLSCACLGRGSLMPVNKTDLISPYNISEDQLVKHHRDGIQTNISVINRQNTSNISSRISIYGIMTTLLRWQSTLAVAVLQAMASVRSTVIGIMCVSCGALWPHHMPEWEMQVSVHLLHPILVAEWSRFERMLQWSVFISLVRVVLLVSSKLHASKNNHVVINDWSKCTSTVWWNSTHN